MKYVLLLLLLVPSAYAGGLVISNSASWENVYSAGVYASLEGHEFRFLRDPLQGAELIDEIEPATEVVVVESDRVPYVKRYGSDLERERKDATSILVPEDSGNLELAKQVQTRKFIIVDPTFGHDAISVAPYATFTQSYVLFADRDNINDVIAFLQNRQPEQVIIYGDVDREIVPLLGQFSPQIINEKGRFLNNIAIAERLRQEAGTKQVILTNGEFIEPDFFSAKHPVLFIGQEVPPADVLDYVRTAEYEAMVLIGNELIPAAQEVKDLVNVPLFIKFAKGRTGTGGFKEVERLDVFIVPAIDLLVSLQGVFYNTETRQVELMLSNERSARTFVRNSIIIKQGDEALQTLGGDVGELDEAETKAFTYGVDLTNQIQNNLTAELFIPYGANEFELERAITATLPLLTSDQNTQCEVEISQAVYNKKTQRFEVTITSQETCYTRVTIKELTVDDQERNPQSEVVKVDGKATITVKQRLNDVDIADNPQITVEARSGVQSEILSKVTEKQFDFKLAQLPLLELLGHPAMISILAIIVILLLLWKRKKR